MSAADQRSAAEWYQRLDALGQCFDRAMALAGRAAWQPAVDHGRLADLRVKLEAMLEEVRRCQG